MAKAAFKKKKKNLQKQIGLKFKEEIKKVLHFEHSCAWCPDWTPRKVIRGKF